MLRRAATLLCLLVVLASLPPIVWGAIALRMSNDRILLARRSVAGDFIPKPYRERLLSQPEWLTPKDLRDSVNRPDVGEMDFPVTLQQIEVFEERFRERAILALTAGLAIAILAAGGWGLSRYRPGR